MLIREYTEADLDALRRMHARQGFDYAFPDLRDPIFVSKLVVEDDAGRVVMASLARLTCEMYLLVDRDAPSSTVILRSEVTKNLSSPSAETTRNSKRDSSGRQERVPQNDDATGAASEARERYAQLLALHTAGERDLLARGLDDAHAWLPPQIARRFGRRLEALGWVRDDAWTPYCKRLKSSG